MVPEIISTQGSFPLHFVKFPLEDLITDAVCEFLLLLEIVEDHHSCMGSSIMKNLDQTTCPRMKKRIGLSKSEKNYSESAFEEMEQDKGSDLPEGTCMTICKSRMHVSELESHPLFAQISIMAWRIRMLWSSTDFKSVL